MRLNLIGFDLETRGEIPEYALQPWRVCFNQASISVANAHLNQTKPQIAAILQDAIDQDAYLVGWNVTFDAAWCIAAGLRDLVFKAKWLDAMLLWRHLEVEREDDDTPAAQRRSWSLEAALKKYFPEAAGFKEFTDFQTDDPEQLRKLVERNVGDIEYTVKLAHQFWAQLTDRQRQAALIEARCIPLVAWANVCGLSINQEATAALDEKLAKDGLEAYQELLAQNPEVAEVDLGSSQKLSKLLFQMWGLTPHKQTDKGADSTDKESLYELAFTDPRAKLVKDIREAKNNRTKFVTAVQKSCAYNPDGKVRPQARIFSTYTSRMSYSSKQKRCKEVNPKTGKEKQVERPIGVALHQWKRGAEYRRQIAAPDGYSLIELDFAGQEFRWMAVASQDPTMLSLCQPGEDAHGYMGSQITRQDYRAFLEKYKTGDKQAKSDRNLGKFSNLAFQYRISARAATAKARVQYELNVEEPFVAYLLSIYKQSFPGVPQYWTNQIYKGKQQGYVETFAGRRVQLNGSWSGREKWPLESTAINYPIQGTGGDQKYLALAVARNSLPTWGAHFYFELHDGLFFICPNAKAQAFAEDFKHRLSNLPYKAAWDVTLPVQFPVDAKLGPTWGDLKEF